MEMVKKKIWDRKGGRPKKNIRRDQQLAVMCTLIERKLVEHKAKKSGAASTSEFLRVLALKGQFDSQRKALPKEVLQLTATLNHIAANINQVAKKCNREETFNPMEIGEWLLLAEQVKNLAAHIKTFFS
jgi:hypothetical protein